MYFKNAFKPCLWRRKTYLSQRHIYISLNEKSVTKKRGKSSRISSLSMWEIKLFHSCIFMYLYQFFLLFFNPLFYFSCTFYAAVPILSSIVHPACYFFCILRCCASSFISLAFSITAGVISAPPSSRASSRRHSSACNG